MKNKKLLVVFIALVMICSVVLAGFTPAAATSNQVAVDTSSVQNGTSNATLSNVSDSLNYNLNTDLLADGVLTNSSELDAVSGVERFDADEEVWVIVEMEGNSLLSVFNESKNSDYSSLQDYVNSAEASTLINSMSVQQSTLIRAVKRANLDMEVKYNYTSILNGFAARVKYGDIAKLQTYSAIKNVIVSEVYAAPEVVENEVKVYDTGIFDSSDCEFQGDGMVVAVLDTGIDYNHEVFDMSMDEIKIKMDYNYIASMIASGELVASSLYDGLDTDDVYYSKKLPFSFDYGDKDPNAYPLNNSHGIHVAGIIGGKSDVITGVAVNAQILGMKVFSDVHTGAYQTDILAALADCITLGVDVINMSLGSAGGYQSVSEGNIIGALYDSLRTAGISMIVAAGNEYNGYMGSAYGSTALTSNPDSGIIGSPASYSTTTAVASINGIQSEYLLANDGETIAFFDNASNAASRQYDFFDMLEQTLKDRASQGVPQFVDGRVTLEYVTVPYLGYNYNYEGIDVENKIALVARGVCTFQDKALYANSNNAIAIVIYNNTTGVIRMSIGNDLKIPACSISKAAGDVMATHTTGTITLDRNNLAGPFMSDFSSWGPLPNLTLSPDITGHGGNIYSAVAGGDRYAIYSGTSMAAPNVAGLTVLLRQYLQTQFPTYTPTQITALANQYMMSTATIANNEDGNPYSPRKQGAGLVNLDACLSTKAYLSVTGSEYTKLSLYDDAYRKKLYGNNFKKGEYTLDFNVNNVSTSALNYSIDMDIMTEQYSYVEDYEVYTVVEKAYMFKDSVIEVTVTNGSYSNGIVTVNAGQAAQISIKITLSEEAKSYLETNFENGMYVEGYAKLISQDTNGTNLNIPYLAFYGNWADAPIFDNDYYAVDESDNDPTLIEEEKLQATTYATTPLSAYYLVENQYDENYLKNTYLLAMGSYIFSTDPGQEVTANRDYNAIGDSTRGTYGIYNVYMGLMRGAKSITLDISEYYTGRTVVNRVYNNVRRAIGQSPSFIYNGDNPGNNSDYVLDNLLFYTQRDGAINNSKYQVTITAAIDYEGGDQVPNNTFSFQFYVDVEDPTVTNVSYRVKENRNNIEKPYSYFMEVSVYDNHYAMGGMLCYLPEESNGTVYEVPGHGVTSFVGNRNSVTTMEIEITDALDYVDENDCLYLAIYDFAMNQGIYKVSLPRNITDCTVAEEDKNIQLDLYATRTVTPIVTPSDQWADGFVWVSSDENVAKVNDKGVIYGVGEGTCTITITDKQLATAEMNEFGGYTATGDPIFANATRWEGSITLTVTVVNPENNRRTEVQPNKLNLEGFTFENSFYRYSGASSDWNDKVLREFLSIDIYPNEKVKIHTNMEPWNIDLSKYRIDWTTSNARTATVDENGVITAIAEGNTIITGRVVDLVSGRTLTSAMTRFVVADPFVISNYVLTKYYGYGDENGVVELPTDTFFNAIGDYAFCYINPQAITNSYDGYHYYYEGNKRITKVVIPEGIESIGKYAFYDCTALQEVVLSTVITQGVTNYMSVISEGAFMGCTNLTSINIGNTADGKCPVTEIDSYAFANCAKLANIDTSVVSWIGDFCFFGCASLTKVDLTKLEITGSYMFAGCTSLQDVVIGDKTKLGAYMFAGCSSIVTITIPGTMVPVAMFAPLTTSTSVLRCSALTEVTFTGAIDSIGDSAFYYCTKLNRVTFTKEATLTDIGVNVFTNCNSLRRFIVPTTNTVLTTENDGAIILNNDKTEFVLIAPAVNMSGYDWSTSTVKTLGQSVFSARTDFSSLDLTDSQVEVIEDYAFYGNRALAWITFPATLKSIGTGAFALCSSLSTVTIPNGVIVGDQAFANCYATANNQITGGLNTVIFGEDVVLGEGAFYACQNLREVTFPADDSIVLGDSCFQFCVNLTSVNFEHLKEIPDFGFTYCVSLALEETTLSHVEKIGAYGMAPSTGSSFLRFPSCTKLDLSSCVELGEYAFAFYIYLEEVVLSENLKEIPERCFSLNTNLTTINLDKVEIIGEYAFASNFGYADGLLNPNTAQINGQNYMQMPTNYPGHGLTDLVLTNVTTIREGAFYFVPWITSIKAPAVTSIGLGAFMGLRGIDNAQSPSQFVVTTRLTDVDFGTADRDITINQFAFAFCEKIENINLENVTSLGANAFYNCRALTSVVLTKLDNDEFTNPEDPEDAIEVSSAFSYCTELTTVSIPALLVVPDRMFEGCTKLTIVQMSEEYTSIGAFAFSDTNIADFTFSSKLENVSDGAFAYTKSLKAFTATVDGVTTENFTINDSFFVEDGMLYKVVKDGGYELITVPAAKTSAEIVVKEGTQRVAAFASVANETVKTLRLPMSLKTIGDSAFDETPNLALVEFRSYRMPELEGSIDTRDYRVASYEPSLVCPGDNIAKYEATRGYVFWYRYYNFYWWSFDQSNDYGLYPSTMKDKLIAVYPSNGVSYDSWVFAQIFKVRSEGAFTMTDESVRALALIQALPDTFRITLNDEAAILAARAAYNASGDASQRYLLTSAYSKLSMAETRLAQLKAGNVPAQEVEPDPKDVKIAELESSVSKLTTAVWVVSALLLLAVVGAALYIFVFSKMTPKAKKTEEVEAPVNEE